MKRILPPTLREKEDREKEKEQENERREQKKEKDNRKPLYSSVNYDVNKAPYYDAINAHVHRWIIKHLKFAQDKSSPIFKYDHVVNEIRKYCEICHELAPMEELSKTEITPIIDIDNYNFQHLENNGIEIDKEEEKERRSYKIVDKLIFKKKKIENKLEKKNVKMEEFENLFMYKNKGHIKYVMIE